MAKKMAKKMKVSLTALAGLFIAFKVVKSRTTSTTNLLPGVTQDELDRREALGTDQERVTTESNHDLW